MGVCSCPFHVECAFNNSPIKTPSDTLLVQLYCRTRYNSCAIAQRLLAGKTVPEGTCPDGDVRG